MEVVGVLLECQAVGSGECISYLKEHQMARGSCGCITGM